MAFAVKASIAATGVAVAALVLPGGAATAWVLPWGEPWLTVVAGATLWVGTFLLAFVGREIVRAARNVVRWSRGQS